MISSRRSGGIGWPARASMLWIIRSKSSFFTSSPLTRATTSGSCWGRFRYLGSGRLGWRGRGAGRRSVRRGLSSGRCLLRRSPDTETDPPAVAGRRRAGQWRGGVRRGLRANGPASRVGGAGQPNPARPSQQDGAQRARFVVYTPAKTQESKNRQIKIEDAEMDQRVQQLRGQFPNEDAFTKALQAKGSSTA